ncbi:hypothetical protein F5Y09DRAFT_313726 [Xylaria sp. FL1042]|nr:hypothetical protein F5Y09DRAFT_313726 [Xylaria sp. FL1042]
MRQLGIICTFTIIYLVTYQSTCVTSMKAGTVSRFRDIHISLTQTSYGDISDGGPTTHPPRPPVELARSSSYRH